jgi:hypothetical protein
LLAAFFHLDDAIANALNCARQSSFAKEARVSFDAVSVMRNEGIPVDSLSDQQRQVLAELSPEETATLVSIQRRVDAAAAADVDGPMWVVGAGIF